MFDIESYVYRRFEYVVTYGTPITDLRVDCPFCPNGDDEQHLHINLHNQRGVHCFKCEYKRTWIHLVMDIDNVSYHHAFNELYTHPNPSNIDKLHDLMQQEVDEKFHSKRKQKQLSSYGMYHHLWDESIPPGSLSLVKDVRLYMVRRHFDASHWKRYNIGLFLSGDYVGRVIIPVEADFFQGRAVYKYLNPKYLSPKNADNTTYLFNNMALEVYDEVVVCEGAFSAMAAGNNAIALIGKNATNGKIRRLLESAVQRFIITCEKNAERNMLELAEALYTNGKSVEFLIYDVGDPADEFAQSRVEQFDNYGSRLKYALVGSL